MALESHDLAAVGCGRNPSDKIVGTFSAIDTLHSWINSGVEPPAGYKVISRSDGITLAIMQKTLTLLLSHTIE
jgi:hypothetical protein